MREPEPYEWHGPHDLVGQAIALRRRERRERHRDQHREQGAEADQPEGRRQPLHHEAAGRDAVEERRAEVAADHAPEEPQYCTAAALSSPHSWMEQGHLLRCRMIPENRPRRIAGTRWMRKRRGP